MSDSTAAEAQSPIWHVTLDQAKRVKPEMGGLSAPVMRHGSMQARYYDPIGEDAQTSHDRDEIYFVADGYGRLVDGDAERHVAPGDLLFVPAGRPHRFVDCTVGFAVWVIFYGPDGGETGR